MRLGARARHLAGLGPKNVWLRLTFARPDESLRVRRAMTRRGVSGGELVIHPRELDHEPVALRIGTTDPTVAWDTFVGRYHLPPSEAGPNPTRIWDLGSNIGLTVAHYATLYRHADITGVELDPETARRATQTLRPWSDRCSVTAGAVWYEDGTVTFSREYGKEHGSRVGDGEHEVDAYSLNTLFKDDEKIDFVKFDIEGAEEQVLQRNVEWADKVGAMKVEVHAPYTLEMCLRDVRGLGFEARPDDRHKAAVVAWR